MELNELAAIQSVLDEALKKAELAKISTFLKREHDGKLTFTITLDAKSAK